MHHAGVGGWRASCGSLGTSDVIRETLPQPVSSISKAGSMSRIARPGLVGIACHLLHGFDAPDGLLRCCCVLFGKLRASAIR